MAAVRQGDTVSLPGQSPVPPVMAEHPRGKRPLTPSAAAALELIAAAGMRRFAMPDFELRMSQRGYNAQEWRSAVTSLLRRQWVTADGSTLFVTDAGWLAATSGEGVPVVRKRDRSRVRSRMPAGLF